MTSDTTPVGYVASASPGTAFGGEAFQAFDQNYYTGWNTTSNYNNNTGVYEGKTSTQVVGVGAVLGEWFQLQTPSHINVSSYSYRTADQNNINGMNTFYLLSSSDGVTWNVADSRTGMAYDTIPKTFTLATPVSALYWRVLVRVVGDPGVTQLRTQCDVRTLTFTLVVGGSILVNQVTSTKTLASQFTNDNELVTRKFVFAHAGEVTNTRAVAINGTIIVGNIEFKVGPVSPAGSATGFSWRAVGNATACSHTITTSYSGGFSEIYFFAKNTYSLGTTFFETPAFTGITHSGLWTELRLVDEGRNQLYSFRSICRGTANPYLTYSITSF